MTEITQPVAHAILINNRKRQLLKRKILLNSLGYLGLPLPFYIKRLLSRFSSRLGYLFYKRPLFLIQDYFNDLTVQIDVRNNIEREMLTGRYDYSLIKVLEKNIKMGMTCIDIGANVGALTLPLAKLVGEAGKILSFEPGPLYFKRLQENLNLNPSIKNRVQCFLLGLSNQNGQLLWQEDPEFPGNAWLLGTSGTAVEVKRLDEVLSSYSLKKLDFIKIDVEGMELEVIEGAVETLKKFKPQILFESSMEFETIRNAPVRKKLLHLLESLDYKIWGIDASGSLLTQTYPNLSTNSFASP